MLIFSSHGRQCVGTMSTSSLVSALAQPCSFRRQGKTQGMRTADIDDGQLQFLAKGSFGYGFPHLCVPARVYFAALSTFRAATS